MEKGSKKAGATKLSSMINEINSGDFEVIEVGTDQSRRVGLHRQILHHPHFITHSLTQRCVYIYRGEISEMMIGFNEEEGSKGRRYLKRQWSRCK